MYLQTEHNFHQDTMTETAPFVGLYDNIIVNYSTAIGIKLLNLSANLHIHI